MGGVLLMFRLDQFAVTADGLRLLGLVALSVRPLAVRPLVGGRSPLLAAWWPSA